MMRRLILQRAAFIAALVVVIGGCSGGMKTMEMTVRGESDMNNGGNAAVVRVYQLSSDNNFSRTSIETFWSNDEQALGDELVSPVDEILLYPDDERAIDLSIAPETRYVGIAADLRSPDPVQWRRVFDAQELRGSRLTVTVGTDRLNVSF